MNPCDAEREALSKRVETLMQDMSVGLSGIENAYLFDAFAVICPKNASKCQPYNGRNALFNDKIHLNVHGSSLMAAPFVNHMKAQGLKAFDLPIVNASEMDVRFQQSHLPFMVATHLSAPETIGRWTDDSPVVMKFAKWFPQNVRLTLELGGAFEGTAKKTVKVNLGGQIKSFEASAAPSEIVLDFFDLPEAVDMITIDIPDPVSPADVGKGADQRKLGLLLSRLHLAPIHLSSH